MCHLQRLQKVHWKGVLDKLCEGRGHKLFVWGRRRPLCSRKWKGFVTTMLLLVTRNPAPDFVIGSFISRWCLLDVWDHQQVHLLKLLFFCLWVGRGLVYFFPQEGNSPNKNPGTWHGSWHEHLLDVVGHVGSMYEADSSCLLWGIKESRGTFWDKQLYWKYFQHRRWILGFWESMWEKNSLHGIFVVYPSL